MQDKRRILTLSLIVLTMLPETIPAVRFVSFGITEGDWLNDWGLIGWLAGGLGFVSDVLTGRVDYPWEDTLPRWVADVIYLLQDKGL